ncbi:hypothetical protein DSECCO2_454170 [anaerobic digester metagenome]|jgi:hypothetical protein
MVYLTTSSIIFNKILFFCEVIFNGLKLDLYYNKIYINSIKELKYVIIIYIKKS